MPRPGRYRLPGIKAPLAGTTALAVLVGAWFAAEGVRNADAVEAPPKLAVQAPQKAQGQGEVPGIPALAPSQPVVLRIPAIGVETALVGLDVLPDGSLDVPSPLTPQLAGWYQRGTTPGAAGTALTVGHYDSATGPAVFYHLSQLGPGHTVEVDRADGRTAVFTVDSVELHDGAAYPDAKVYGSTGRAELRVITCGGAYLPAGPGSPGGYQANTVVYAHLTGVR
ncbi:class F sortase [Streptomyces indicus]|uniref:Sortase family protein n=1 Tax=Streptomyces indicus TaxID=417292 RepID=A0A1G9GB07_9ACTN|nr:class F sortase [Streptomyces indicus]SDK97878.1 Sortase family protein [Streptomyces indicus]